MPKYEYAKALASVKPSVITGTTTVRVMLSIIRTAMTPAGRPSIGSPTSTRMTSRGALDEKR